MNGERETVPFEAIGSDRLDVRFTPLFEVSNQDRLYIDLVAGEAHRVYVEAIKLFEAANVAYLSIAKGRLGRRARSTPVVRNGGTPRVQRSRHPRKTLHRRAHRPAAVERTGDLVAFG